MAPARKFWVVPPIARRRSAAAAGAPGGAPPSSRRRLAEAVGGPWISHSWSPLRGEGEIDCVCERER